MIPDDAKNKQFCGGVRQILFFFFFFGSPNFSDRRVTLYQDKLTTDKKSTVGYSNPDEIPTSCFQLCELV